MILKKGMKVCILDKDDILKRYIQVDYDPDVFRPAARHHSIHLRGDMIKGYCGKEVTIMTNPGKHCTGREITFRIQEDRGRWNWSDNMVCPIKDDCNDLIFGVLRGQK